MAASKDTRKYSLPLKGSTILQNTPDRGIGPVIEVVRHDRVAGESPTTGLPWEGEYLPMLVQIGNSPGTRVVNGRTVNASGIGKRAPWGVQHADVVYEGILYRGGDTRFTYLFSDSFAEGQPEKGVGPVRSARIGDLLLREEWQAGLVYTGNNRSSGSWAELLRQTGVDKKDVLFSLLASRYVDFKYPVKGVMPPDNFNADIIGLRKLIPASSISQSYPFLFADESPYSPGYEAAHAIRLDWGTKNTTTHFQYDEEANVYRRFCGTGTNKARWAPYLSFATTDGRKEENMRPILFANLIVQRVEYKYENDNILMPVMEGVGRGNADIFIGGRYIPGYWIRNSIADPTVFCDDQGNEIKLLRGKTFIAHFPPESLCTFTGE